MRITNTMLVNNMKNYIAKNLNRMEKYQQMLANGKVISVPSDDPVVAARALKLRTDLAEVNQYDRNVNDAISWVETTEGALGNIGDVLQRIRELTVQGASSQFVDDDIKKINEEIKQLKTQLVNIGNTTYAGRYIFSGFSTDKKLLNDDGTFAVDVGTNENIRYEISVGDTINVNVFGGDVFNNGMAAVGSTSGNIVGETAVNFPLEIAGFNNSFDISVNGEDYITVNITEGTYNNIDEVINELQDSIDTVVGSKKVDVKHIEGKLVFSSVEKGDDSSVVIDPGSGAAFDLGVDTVIATQGRDGETGTFISHINELINRFEIGDREKIGEMLGFLDEDLNNVLRVRSDIGARQNRLELTSNRLSADITNFTNLMSKNEDADMTKVIMDLQNEENVYKASLAGGARIIMPTLMDFLR